MPQMLEGRGYAFKPNGDSEVNPIRDSFVVGARLRRLRNGAGVPLGGMHFESLWLAWLRRRRLAVVVGWVRLCKPDAGTDLAGCTRWLLFRRGLLLLIFFINGVC